jgi:legumain
MHTRTFEITLPGLVQVLIGQDPGVGSRKVLKSGPNDRVFINFADHGGVGLIAFPLGKIVTSKQLTDTLLQMVFFKKKNSLE